MKKNKKGRTVKLIFVAKGTQWKVATKNEILCIYISSVRLLLGFYDTQIFISLSTNLNWTNFTGAPNTAFI